MAAATTGSRKGRRPSRRFMLGKALRDFFADECWDRAAALTLFGLLAVPPLAIALTSVLALLGQGPEGTDMIMEVLAVLAPDEAALETLSRPVLAVLDHPAAGSSLLLGLAFALWISAGYVGAFGRAMNQIYRVPEGRPMVILLGWHLLTTIVLVAFVVLVVIVLVLSGPVAATIGRELELGDAVVVGWDLARWPLLLLTGVVVVALLYYATPNVRRSHFRLVSHGSLLAMGLIVVASFAFRAYVTFAGRFSVTYGSALAGIVVFGLWLWIINMALLFGAEVDREIARARQLVRGVRADRELQVQVRDDRASTKVTQRRHADEARARSLRESWTDGAE